MCDAPDPSDPSRDAGPTRHRVFLLSPAQLSGRRALLLLRPGGDFDLARRLHAGEPVGLGETFRFLSALYFRGKLAYAERFASPPPGIADGVLVITAGGGLVPARTRVSLERLHRFAAVPIDPRERRYTAPLVRDARRLAAAAGEGCEFVLLGSVATVKYTAPLGRALGPRLRYPAAFPGLGDMSRGSILLKAAAAGRELDYVAAG